MLPDPTDAPTASQLRAMHSQSVPASSTTDMCEAAPSPSPSRNVESRESPQQINNPKRPSHLCNKSTDGVGDESRRTCSHRKDFIEQRPGLGGLPEE